MINFFKQRSIFLMAAFFVFCENKGMNTLIPYEFCGKKIKGCSFLEKIPMIKQNNTLLGNDIYIKVGENLIGSDSCNFILASWQHKYSVNQYINFICLASKFAEKVTTDPFILIHAIDTIFEGNFFKAVEIITMQEIAKKVNKNQIITVIEYELLNSISVKKDILPIKQKIVWVKRTGIEKFYSSKKEVAEKLKILQIVNISLFSLLVNYGIFPIEGAVVCNAIATPLQLAWCIFCDQNNAPILKPCEFKIID